MIVEIKAIVANGDGRYFALYGIVKSKNISLRLERYVFTK